MTKPEVSSIGFLDIVKKISEDAGENVPVRRTVQKIMLKLVAEHDRSKVRSKVYFYCIHHRICFRMNVGMSSISKTLCSIHVHSKQSI